MGCQNESYIGIGAYSQSSCGCSRNNSCKCGGYHTCWSNDMRVDFLNNGCIKICPLNNGSVWNCR